MNSSTFLSNFLANSPLFSSLSENELEEFAELWTLSAKDENSIIFTKGDSGELIYLIQSGSVSISVAAIDNKPLILSVLGEGDLIGELTLLENKSRTATATTNAETTLYEMPKKTFIAFIQEHPKVALALINMLGERLQHSNLMMTHQVTKNANEEIERELTQSERFADGFANFIGSWTFILIFFAFIAVWMFLNIYALIFRPVDPYPFILLNLGLSCLAAFQAPIIMMSQGRQSKKDRIQAELNYTINLKEERMIQDILNKVTELSAKEEADKKNNGK